MQRGRVMRKYLPAIIIQILSLLLVIPGVEAQSSISLVAEKDNTILSEFTNNSNGSGSFLFTGTTNTMGHRRALLYFNLEDTIPAGAAHNKRLSIPRHLSVHLGRYGPVRKIPLIRYVLYYT